MSHNNEITVRDPRKPRVPGDVRVTLSQFTSVSLLTGDWKLTPNEIMRVLNSRNGSLPKLTREELLWRLNDACTEGCLENNNGGYQLTDKGIDITGTEYKAEPDRYGLAGTCRAIYLALPR